MLTCANCGERNPERARFCLSCGAPLAAEQRRGARKVVTVVVCDVTGSTALGERLDPESLGRVMARYFERTRAVLERHHGLVQKFIGDEAGPALEVRIGVSNGEVMVEEAGGDPLVIGEAVNLATRLQAAAGPGQVLLDRRTWHLARDALVAAEVEGLEAWRLVDVSPDAPGHARRHDSPLVGRLAELQLFDWVVQAAFWGPTPVADGIRRCHEIRGRVEGSYRVEMSALHTLAGLHAMAGELDQARQLGDAAAQIAGKLGPGRFAAICSQFLGQVELLAGDPEAAERWLRWGVQILERMEERGLRSELTANLARALAAQDRDDEALELTLRSGELAVRDDLYAQVERRGPLAAVLARQGRLAEAERVAAEAVELGRDSDMLAMQAGALLDLARVLRLAGRDPEALPLARQALALAERKGHRVAAAQARDLLGG